MDKNLTQFWFRSPKNRLHKLYFFVPSVHKCPGLSYSLESPPFLYIQLHSDLLLSVIILAGCYKTIALSHNIGPFYSHNLLL